MTDTAHWQLARSPSELLTLDPQFMWTDELDWTALAQSEPTYTLTGSVDIQQGTKQAGRPITLKGDDVWIAKGDLLQLQDWASVPELTLTLTHPDGRTFNVIFNRPAIFNIKQVVLTQPSDDDSQSWYQADLAFLTV